jgi:molybdenum cofactor cytidylyltransferase
VTPRLSGVVLAAGAGVRMGGPKALLLLEGEPLAAVHARRLREAGCGRIVIVTRRELVAQVEGFAGGALVVASEAPDPAGSLAVGLGALALAGGDAIVVTPVDAWPARAETIARLVEAVEAGAEAATPRHEGKGGHPVVIRVRAMGAAGEMRETGQAAYSASPRPLRDVLAALGDARVRVDVDDPSIAIDLDTPEDVRAITGEAPSFSGP